MVELLKSHRQVDMLDLGAESTFRETLVCSWHAQHTLGRGGVWMSIHMYRLSPVQTTSRIPFLPQNMCFSRSFLFESFDVVSEQWPVGSGVE